jgi:hypothetical protein
MNFYKSQLAVLCALPIVLYSEVAFAHKGVKHTLEKKTEIEVEDRPSVMQEIQANYAKHIDTLLKRGCGDCHSSDTRFPWYAKFPLIDTLIANDIAEAHEHLDISSGFPFKGHGSPIEDLKATRDVLQDNTMPPLGYRLLHRSQNFTEKEKTSIFRWIEESLERLETKK